MESSALIELMSKTDEIFLFGRLNFNYFYLVQFYEADQVFMELHSNYIYKCFSRTNESVFMIHICYMSHLIRTIH